MKEIQDKIDSIYSDVTRPLKSFSSQHEKGSLLRITEYMKVLGAVMGDFADKANLVGNELFQKFPDKREEIKQAINETKDKIVSNYKPK